MVIARCLQIHREINVSFYMHLKAHLVSYTLSRYLHFAATAVYHHPAASWCIILVFIPINARVQESLQEATEQQQQAVDESLL